MKVMNPRLVRVARRLDFIWRALRVLYAPRSLRRDAPVRSILVVDLHLVGDMVMLLPLLASLRRRYPDARISLLAGPWCEVALAGTDTVDEVVPYAAGWVKYQSLGPSIRGFWRTLTRLRRSEWDVGIDVRGDIRHILLLFLAGCRRRVGFDFTGGAALLTDVVPDDGELRHILDHHQRIAAALDAFDGQDFVPSVKLSGPESAVAEAIPPFIGFHFGASLPLRRLPADDAAALITMHDSTNEPLVLFSSPDMEPYVAEILARLPGRVGKEVEVWRGDLRAFVVKASRARRMFAMDSGPAHIAAALSRETIVFFGPNLPQYTAPRGVHVRVVEDRTVRCRPCDQRHCVNATYQACMRGLVDQWRLRGRDGESVRARSAGGSTNGGAATMRIDAPANSPQGGFDRPEE